MLAAGAVWAIDGLWASSGLVTKRLKRVAGDSVQPVRSSATRPSGIVMFLRELSANGISLAARFSSSATQELIAKKLVLAGSPSGLTASQFVGIRWIVLLAMTAVPAILVEAPPASGATKAMLMVAAAATSWLGFGLYLERLISTRQRAIVAGLPDALDVLTVCVEAGLGFDAALSRVVEKFVGPLADEFRRLLQDVRMGRPRRDSLRDFGTRSGVDDMNTFATAIIQADQLGVSIANILRSQSDKLRMERKQRAEEKAMKAPVKMLLPMVVFIFPALLMILLGPAVIQVMTTFATK